MGILYPQYNNINTTICSVQRLPTATHLSIRSNSITHLSTVLVQFTSSYILHIHLQHNNNSPSTLQRASGSVHQRNTWAVTQYNKCLNCVWQPWQVCQVEATSTSAHLAVQVLYHYQYYFFMIVEANKKIDPPPHHGFRIFQSPTQAKRSKMLCWLGPLNQPLVQTYRPWQHQKRTCNRYVS